MHILIGQSTSRGTKSDGDYENDKLLSIFYEKHQRTNVIVTTREVIFHFEHVFVTFLKKPLVQNWLSLQHQVQQLTLNDHRKC